ncbi:EexN family lipoprotein [Enterovibrio calviensis]|uniref:EexN family lipoprotein n=1 Tax=Enterovibrio calviensis TaxID=91359 RepID=UPI00054D2AB4
MKLYALPLLVFVVSGCAEDEVPRDRDWYMSNVDAMKVKVEECKNDARIADTPNCKNALNAISQLAILDMFKTN